MRARCSVLSLALALSAIIGAAGAATPVRVNPADLHLEQLRPATMTYLVYMHGAAGSGVKRAMLATSEVKREQVDGKDAWVIEQHWEDENGSVHTARTVHAAKDAATLSQTSGWTRPDRRLTTIVEPATGRGSIEGELPEESRKTMEAGFAAMQDGWWMNWHSDLTLLPLLPYEKGGTLRIRLFDVGMAAPMDVDYTVLGERALVGADGRRRDCWLVETESGRPGSGNYQRFWIDKASRVVVKEEDVFNGKYRSKVLLEAPAVIEFPLPPTPAAQG
ncbi:hypothetical protein H9L17_15715 [Thermomonas brevis]|uniref:DUF3108 domain-containing protein n=1 Tax=Thermomonas brevis TaxID=215691 RepID=A0A7G9QTA8_9GAMM|nr:hypothetical protein [Thermomonas brevis]QNN46583.1 hypothetical protein H9L17_15715 [Thermomonas brevis]